MEFDYRRALRMLREGPRKVLRDEREREMLNKSHLYGKQVFRRVRDGEIPLEGDALENAITDGEALGLDRTHILSTIGLMGILSSHTK